MAPFLARWHFSRLDLLLGLLVIQASSAAAQGDPAGHHHALRGSMRVNSAMQGMGLGGRRHRCNAIQTVLPAGRLLPETVCDPPGSTDCRAIVSTKNYPGRAREDLGEEVTEDPDRTGTATRRRLPALMPRRRDLSTPDGVNRFKAQVLNNFVVHNKLTSVVEIGYSYGHESFHEMLQVPRYLGYDTSLDLWRFYYERFQDDHSKQFFHYEGSLPETATGELCLSMGVIPRLESRYEVSNHLRNLFKFSSKYIAIFSSNYDSDGNTMLHIKHHKFTNWVDYQFGDSWRLIASLPNRFPNQSPYDFYFYKNKNWEQECGSKEEADEDGEETFKYWSSPNAAYQRESVGRSEFRIHSGTPMSMGARKQQLGFSDFSHRELSISKPVSRTPIRRNYNHYGSYGDHPLLQHVPNTRMHASQVQRANLQYGKKL